MPGHVESYIASVDRNMVGYLTDFSRTDRIANRVLQCQHHQILGRYFDIVFTGIKLNNHAKCFNFHFSIFIHLKQHKQHGIAIKKKINLFNQYSFITNNSQTSGSRALAHSGRFIKQHLLPFMIGIAKALWPASQMKIRLSSVLTEVSISCLHGI